MSDAPVLEARGVTKRFGGLAACDRVDLSIERGAFVALIGPNGAGKTTLFDVLAGATRPDDGRVLLHDRDVTAKGPHARAAMGLGRTFQIPRPFGRMTVQQNLLVAGTGHAGERLLGGLAGRGKPAETKREARAADVLAFLNLDHMADAYAATLSGGQRKLLELARALMLEPSVLLLDEPLAGVNPTLGRTIMDRLLELHAGGVTLALVEHDVEAVMRNCPRVVVMAQGQVLLDGSPDDVKRDPRVLDAYLGSAPPDAEGAA